MEVLRTYEKWRLNGTENRAEGHWEYDASDLERLGKNMRLTVRFATG